MWKDAYIEGRVLSADPVELVCLVYGHAIESIQEARRRLAAGDIAARSRAISRAIAAVSQLQGSLDHAAGGTVSRRLEGLYSYIRQRLTEGNMRQKDAPLAESESLLQTLAEAWSAVRPPPAEASSAARAPQAEFPEARTFPAPHAGPWMESDAGRAHTWSA
jgi:flagellar protein FliS